MLLQKGKLTADLSTKEQALSGLQTERSSWIQEKEQINQELSTVRLQNEIHSGLIQKFERLARQKSEVGQFKKAILEFETNMKNIQVQMDAHKSMEADGFLAKMKTNYPALSPRELRLCSYLKLNVSSKEIAEYLGISIRGVESLRYRIRKKLNLDTGQDLTEFILSL